MCYFFLAFSLFKMCESVKVWKWSDFFTFFIFFREKFANTIIRIVTLQRNSEKPRRNQGLCSPHDEEALRNRWGGLEVTKVSSRVRDLRAPHLLLSPFEHRDEGVSGGPNGDAPHAHRTFIALPSHTRTRVNNKRTRCFLKKQVYFLLKCCKYLHIPNILRTFHSAREQRYSIFY